MASYLEKESKMRSQLHNLEDTDTFSEGKATSMATSSLFFHCLRWGHFRVFYTKERSCSERRVEVKGFI